MLKGHAVAEIETDKAVVEIAAPADGMVGRIITEAGTAVTMGETVGVVNAG